MGSPPPEEEIGLPPLRRPRLVATDLDGTLLRSDGTIDERTRAALRCAERAGALVVFVTGRPPRWMHHVDGALDHTVAICANGALVYDMHDARIVTAHRIDADTLRETAARLVRALPDAVLAVEYGVGFASEPDYEQHPSDQGATDLLVCSREELLSRPAVKLLLRDAGVDPDELQVTATAAVGDLVTVTRSSPHLLEISARGVTKASALADLAAQHGIDPGEAVAFGDMPNDLAVLGWAGHSVAVANAHPAVLAAADEITAHHDEHGVAQVLERLYPPPAT